MPEKKKSKSKTAMKAPGKKSKKTGTMRVDPTKMHYEYSSQLNCDSEYSCDLSMQRKAPSKAKKNK
ncbi:MAG: hypothetical protein FWE36_01575 [Erysipelotrichales bacterium]|nr:hypothetical protein [Erysipelotrichales bacterium]